MLERLVEPFLGLLVPGQSAVALTQQVLQLRQLGGRRLALRIPRDLLEQVRQVALGVAVPFQLQGEVGAPALELRVAGVIPEGFLVDQEDPLRGR